MQYRILGRTQLRVSEVGFGGGRIRADQPERDVVPVIQRALDRGINFIDTAPDYGQGRSEELIGKAIQGRREQCVIATKTEAFDPKGIVADIEGSLRRLQTDVIDVLQFHGGWFPEEDARQVMEGGGLQTYQTLRDEGKIRFLAFSADGPSAGVERFIASGQFDVMQIHYNLMYQSTCDLFANRGVMVEAEAQEMGIVLMRSTTSQAFPRLMQTSFPGVAETQDLDRFLLNFVLSNPLVDVALMSLRNLADVEWTDSVSEDGDARLDLKAIHGR